MGCSSKRLTCFALRLFEFRQFGLHVDALSLDVACGNLRQRRAAAAQFLAIQSAVLVVVEPLEHDFESRPQFLRDLVAFDSRVAFVSIVSSR